jgi:hypothetical protein
MTKHTFTLEGEATFTKGPRDKSWTAAVVADLGGLSTEIVQRLVMHGLQQKVADAASGATSQAEAAASMDKAITAILAGEWTSRVAGAGVDEETTVRRMIAKAAVKASWGAKSEKWAAFTGLSDDEQAAKLDTVYADNEAAFAEPVAAKLAERKADRERKAKLASGLSINI